MPDTFTTERASEPRRTRRRYPSKRVVARSVQDARAEGIEPGAIRFHANGDITVLDLRALRTFASHVEETDADAVLADFEARLGPPRRA